MRTPRLRHCRAAVVRDAGFAYDASPHPTWVPGRYFGLHYRREPWREEGIIRVPISVLPGLRMPVSWMWFQLAGSRLGLLGAPALISAHTGSPFLEGLDRLLAWSKGRLTSMSVGDVVTSLKSV